MLGALNGLDELFSLVNILGFLPECDLLICNTFTLSQNKVMRAAQGATAKDFDDFIQQVRKELGTSTNARIALKSNSDTKFALFTLCGDPRKMKKIAANILQHLEQNNLLPNVAFPPMSNYVEYSLEIKQLSQYLQPFNLEDLKRKLDEEIEDQEEQDVETDEPEEESDLEIMEEEQGSTITRQKKRGRPRKNQIVSIEDFLSELQRKSSQENSRKKQKIQ